MAQDCCQKVQQGRPTILLELCTGLCTKASFYPTLSKLLFKIKKGQSTVGLASQAQKQLPVHQESHSHLVYKASNLPSAEPEPTICHRLGRKSSLHVNESLVVNEKRVERELVRSYPSLVLSHTQLQLSYAK